MIKAVLALHYKVLPPHAGVESPLSPLRDGSSPIYMRGEPAPWIRPPCHPRRAAVSAFGFGGTNFHAVLEEYADAVKPSVPGGEDWPCELFAWKSRNRETLLAELLEFQGKALSSGETLSKLASSVLAEDKPDRATAALCLTAANQKELADALELAISALNKSQKITSPNIQLRIGKTEDQRACEGGISLSGARCSVSRMRPRKQVSICARSETLLPRPISV